MSDVVQRSWNLGGGVTITVLLPVQPGALSRANFDRLTKYVAALEAEASISWEAEGSPGGQ